MRKGFRSPSGGLIFEGPKNWEEGGVKAYGKIHFHKEVIFCKACAGPKQGNDWEKGSRSVGKSLDYRRAGTGDLF